MVPANQPILRVAANSKTVIVSLCGARHRRHYGPIHPATSQATRRALKPLSLATIAEDSSTNLGFLFSLNSTNLGFAVESFAEAENVTEAILDQIDIPCPPTS